MKVWVKKEGLQVRLINKQQEFFAVQVELPEDLVDAVLAFQDKFSTYQAWLRKVEGALATRNPAVEIEEAPSWLGADADKKQGKQGTAQRSSKTSPTKRKKKVTRSSTSRESTS